MVTKITVYFEKLATVPEKNINKTKLCQLKTLLYWTPIALQAYLMCYFCKFEVIVQHL